MEFEDYGVEAAIKQIELDQLKEANIAVCLKLGIITLEQVQDDTGL